MFERKVLATFILFISLLFLSGHGFGQDTKDLQIIQESNKVALVIGNSNYKNSFSVLKSPRNDAVKMAEALKRLGFRLVGDKAHLDMTLEQMEALLDQFTDEIKSGGVGFFYFSGHGSQDNKRDNFLIPVDTAIRYQGDLKHKALSVEQITDRMEEAKNRLNILVLDACRNNVLPTGFKSGGKGLNTSVQDIPNGVYIAFAARDGQTAADGDYNGYSLYTRELLKNIERPNTRLEDIFILTRAAVKKESGNAQIPFDYGSLDDIFYFRTDGQTQQQPPPRFNSSSQNQTVLNSSLQTPVVINSDLDGEASFNYKINDKFAIGTGVYKITTSWSERSSDCVWAYSDKNDGVANSKLKSFDSVFDVTVFDMSLRARQICLNQIAIFKNKLNYYAIVQVLKVSRSENLLSIRYKILPNRLQPNWENNYFSNANAGRVTFDFSNNKGKFVIGKNDFTFVTQWSACNSDCIYLYDYTSNIKQVVLATDSAPIKNSKDASRYPKVESVIKIKRGERAVLKNSKGKYAVIKIIDIKGEEFSSDRDEVVFEYEILSD